MGRVLDARSSEGLSRSWPVRLVDTAFVETAHRDRRVESTSSRTTSDSSGRNGRLPRASVRGAPIRGRSLVDLGVSQETGLLGWGHDRRTRARTAAAGRRIAGWSLAAVGRRSGWWAGHSPSVSVRAAVGEPHTAVGADPGDGTVFVDLEIPSTLVNEVVMWLAER